MLYSCCIYGEYCFVGLKVSVFKKITALIFAILVFTVSASVIVINVTVTVKSILEPNAPPEIFGYSAIAIADGSSESNKSDSINRGSIAIFKKEKIEIEALLLYLKRKK